MKALKKIGIVMMVLGFIAIIAAFPFVSQSALGELVGKVPSINATRIIVGIVLFILGLLTYSGKEGSVL